MARNSTSWYRTLLDSAEWCGLVRGGAETCRMVLEGMVPHLCGIARNGIE